MTTTIGTIDELEELLNSPQEEEEAPKGRHRKEEPKLPENDEQVKALKRRIRRKRFAFETGDLVLMVLQISVLILAVISTFPFLMKALVGYDYNTILSPSMSGTVEQGEIVVTQPYMGQNLGVGQIVGVDNGYARYLHRIVEVETDLNGVVTYRTQGDANNLKDFFHPTADDIWGTPVSFIHAPLSEILTFFSFNSGWLDSFNDAFRAGDFSTVWQLMPDAPWGMILLIAAVLVFWWVIPDLIAKLKNRAESEDQLALELLKKAVASHEIEIEEELKPVVTELKEESDHVKAEKEADLALRVETEKAFYNAFTTISPEDIGIEEEEAPLPQRTSIFAPEDGEDDEYEELLKTIEEQELPKGTKLPDFGNTHNFRSLATGNESAFYLGEEK